MHFANCINCQKAVRAHIYLLARGYDSNIEYCSMYDHIKEMDVTLFTASEKIGRLGNSKIENAILQVLKCVNCAQNYQKVLEMSCIANSIPYCFYSMNEVPNGAMMKVRLEADSVLKSSGMYECKEMSVLQSKIAKILKSDIYEISENDYEQIAELLKNVNTNFYIHPYTVKYLLSQMKK